MKLKGENGHWWRGEEICEKVVVNYFSDLFFFSFPKNILEVCAVVWSKLKLEHTSYFEGSFTT